MNEPSEPEPAHAFEHDAGTVRVCQVGVHHLVREVVNHGLQARTVGLVQLARQLFEVRTRDPTDQHAEHGVLVGEILVERAQADAGALAQSLDRDTLDRLAPADQLVDGLERRLHQRARSRLSGLAPKKKPLTIRSSAFPTFRFESAIAQRRP